MGSLRFSIARPELLGADVDRLAFVAGADDIPWQSEILWTEDGLSAEREEHDSGCFHVPWRLADGRQLLLSTATLMERREPYRLAVEIARGTLNRLQNHLFGWAAVGMVIPAEAQRVAHEAIENFAGAISTLEEPVAAATAAQAAIETAVRAMHLLAVSYCQQSLEFRHTLTPRLPVLQGGCVAGPMDGPPDGPLVDADRREPYLAAFNSVSLEFNWPQAEPAAGEREWTAADNQIAWCLTNRLRVCGGPLVRFDRASVPDWMYLYEQNFDGLLSLAAARVAAVVTRYRGKVGLWQCAAALNTAEDFTFSEEEQLRMAVQLIESTRNADPKTPVLLGFDQPWAEYMARREVDLSPLHFADTLARAELGLSGLNLEIDFGWCEGKSLPRDLMELSKLIDRWSCLGLPLFATLTAPPPDLLQALGPAWLNDTMSMLLAKQAVQGVFWKADAAENGGNPGSPLLTELAEIRATHLI